MLPKLNPRILFRTIAVAEAVSWAGLLAGMYFKWVAASTEVGVKVFGPVHGTVFIVYVLTVLYVRRPLRWDARTFLLAGFASLPPFATLAFEIWADRRALLGPAGSVTTADSEETVPVAS